MKKTVYIETTIISYLTAHPVKDIIQTAKQKITKKFWEVAEKKYSMLISDIVYEEAILGNEEASKKRMAIMEGIKILPLTPAVEKTAKAYIRELNIPKKAIRDALHLAVASAHNIDFLVTWNCAHIANAETIKKLVKINKNLGAHTPIICTPNELIGD